MEDFGRNKPNIFDILKYKYIFVSDSPPGEFVFKLRRCKSLCEEHKDFFLFRVLTLVLGKGFKKQSRPTILRRGSTALVF